MERFLFANWPFPAAVAVLFGVVCLRAGATYALGRGVRHGARGTRLRRMVDSPAYRRAERLVARWGALAVVACFLTVGVQTMINLVAGATRMPLRRYLPALALGGLVWAVIYATLGSVTWTAFWLLYQRSPVIAVVLLAALVAGLVIFIVMQVRGGRRAQLMASASSSAGRGNG